MDILKAVKNNIAQIVVGNDAAIELVMIALVANGHILLEDVLEQEKHHGKKFSKKYRW